MNQDERIVTLIVLVGELLLKSGAEIYRVEETAERMGRQAGFAQVDVFATPTGIFLTMIAAEGRVYTRVRRIRRIDNNLAKIAVINSLSRRFVKGLSLDKLEQELYEIKLEDPPYGIASIIAGGLGSGAFALIFGGNASQALFSALIGLVVVSFVRVLELRRPPRFLVAVGGAMLAAGLGVLADYIWAFPTDITILAGVMVLVPGVALMTSVRDMLSGELVSGVARGAEATTIAVAVAAGVAIVLGIRG